MWYLSNTQWLIGSQGNPVSVAPTGDGHEEYVLSVACRQHLMVVRRADLTVLWEHDIWRGPITCSTGISNVSSFFSVPAVSTPVKQQGRYTFTISGVSKWVPDDVPPNPDFQDTYQFVASAESWEIGALSTTYTQNVRLWPNACTLSVIVKDRQGNGLGGRQVTLSRTGWPDRIGTTNGAGGVTFPPQWAPSDWTATCAGTAVTVHLEPGTTEYTTITLP